jgi:serine/threonine protein kinase
MTTSTATASILSSSSSSITAAIHNFEKITAANRALNQELMEFETSRSSVLNSSRGSLLSRSNHFHNSRGSLQWNDSISNSILHFESSKSSIDYVHEATTKDPTNNEQAENLESYIKATKEECCDHERSLRFSDLDDGTEATLEESCSDLYSLSTASTSCPSTKHQQQQHWKPARPTFTPLEIDEDTESSFPENVEEWNFVKILGEGQFGQVWQVDRKDDEKNFRSYALKCLSKYEIVMNGQVELITQEKNIMRKINHPNIIRLRAAWHDENLIYLLQDFLQGGELYTIMLDKNAKYGDEEIPPRRILPEADAQFYAACIADALVYLHTQRIVFRDLKPENVLLDHLGYPVLIDLGLAKILDASDDEIKTYTMVGTPRYLSPEQIEGCGHSFGVDHWALAILTYEMLTGTHPFDEWDGTDEMALYTSISDTPYRPFLTTSKVSAKAKNWIDRLFEKNPTKRLGYSNRGSEILAHPWLATMDPNALRHRRYEAPWVPQLVSLADSSHFDDWDHLVLVVRPEYPKLTTREAALFAMFDGS